MITSQDADGIFARLGAEYEQRKTAAESQVEDWIWAMAPWWDPRPLWFERQNHLPGRILKGSPKNVKNRVEGGIAGNGRLLVQRDHTKFGYYQTFYRWEEDLVESAHYHHYANEPINVLLLNGGSTRPRSCDHIAEQGWSHEEYVWSGHQIAEVRVSHAKRVRGRYESLHAMHTAIPIYSGEQLERVELHWPPQGLSRPEGIIEIAFQRADA